MSDLLLDSLEISNFRAFDHLKIEKLGRVNLIVGENSVGKTSILEAIKSSPYSDKPVTIFSSQIDYITTSIALSDTTKANFSDEVEQDILTALQSIEPNLERFIVIDDTKINAKGVVIELQNLEQLPLTHLGNGISRIFDIAVYLLTCANNFALIDEIETGLHDNIQIELWRMIFKLAHRLNIQVFATTHSWDCILSFQKASEEDKNEEAMLIRLDKKDGRIIVTLYDERLVEMATRLGVDIRG
jgi:AAA15 family ATPase/GTPase